MRTTAILYLASAVVLTLTFLVPVDVLAKERLKGSRDTMDPRILAMGGALRAAPSGPGSVYMNPANLAMVPLYHVELMYQYTGNDDMHMTGIAIADSVTSVLAAGASFNYSWIGEEFTNHKSYDGRVSLSAAFGNVFYLGLTGRYLYLANNTGRKHRGPGGVAALPGTLDTQVDGMTLDAGASLRLGGMLTLAAVGYNLTYTESVYAPLKLGGAAAFQLGPKVVLETDLVTDFTSYEKNVYELRAGGEFFVGGYVPLRAGYVYDSFLRVHSMSAGIGYVDDRFAIDFAYVQELKKEGELMIAVGFKYFVS